MRMVKGRILGCKDPECPEDITHQNFCINTVLIIGLNIEGYTSLEINMPLVLNSH